ncbi:unnamed protein product [Paramecium sonneborni]|uniref:Transmembrane protein n=1 Tax=Paramecium sonneborni TaxID=65129 RepID=A0A8S1PTZ5_9CILI|nr:unnamed protein product [Paramecium sonneborni]
MKQIKLGIYNQQLDQSQPEITLDLLLKFILKMLYVQLILLTLVYIFAFLTYYLEELQHIFFFQMVKAIYITLSQSFLQFFFGSYFVLKEQKMQLICIYKMILQWTLFIIMTIIIIILFGNLLGLIALYWPYQTSIFILVYIVLLGYTIVISFIIVLINVPPAKFTFEQLAAVSILSQLILFIIFVSIYNEEWFFIATCWLFHYFYCLCMLYEIIQISIGYDIYQINEYQLAGLILYILATCLAVGFIGIATIYLIFKSIQVLFLD